MTDPDSVHRNSWDQVFELFQLYLVKQNVCINITSFAPTLQEALNHLRQQGQAPSAIGIAYRLISFMMTGDSLLGTCNHFNGKIRHSNCSLVQASSSHLSRCLEHRSNFGLLADLLG